MSTKIRHHPDDATLLSYAAASLAEPLAAVVASHVSMCPRCRAEVADLERLGSALMLSEPRSSGGGRLAAPRRPSDDERRPRHFAPAQSEDPLPFPIAYAYGLSLEQIPWKRLGPGVWHHRLALQQPQSGDLRLLRIGGGRAMPEHGHRGSELTLVIEGAYADATGEYRRGDIQDIDEAIEHQPVVEKGSECICLIASEHPARFKTLVGRIIQPWTGL
jgi:putative transcriptional regulator